MFTVYILRTSSNTLYVGQTNDLEKRLEQHLAKSTKGAKYLRLSKSFSLVHSEIYTTRSEAMKREWQLKQLTRKQKDAVIIGDKTISHL
jgi:putative endonuclease